MFGNGTLEKLPEVVAKRRVLLVTTSGFTRRGVTSKVIQMLEPNVVHVLDDVRANPDVSDLEDREQTVRELGIEVIVALGGGSVIDTGKVLSAVIGLDRKDRRLRERLGRGELNERDRRIPVVALPTTAGTGSEVTPFATVWERRSKKKYSMSGRSLFPETAIVDPLLTLSLPRESTLAAALDAVSQAFEAIWNRNANPITSLYATESLRISLSTIEALVENLDARELRTKMAYASLLAGLAISHTRTALAHSMSYPLTLHFGVPHGLACSFSLPAILELNARADDGRLAKLAHALGFLDTHALVDHLDNLMHRLRIKEWLMEYVPSIQALCTLIDEMFAPDRVTNNLVSVNHETVEAVLRRSLS